nr:MAG TPA: hypothetical protein [Caudoviricetes sp.]
MNSPSNSDIITSYFPPLTYIIALLFLLSSVFLKNNS